jgi:hypothetical protein
VPVLALALAAVLTVHEHEPELVTSAIQEL